MTCSECGISCDDDCDWGSCYRCGNAFCPACRCVGTVGEGPKADGANPDAFLGDFVHAGKYMADDEWCYECQAKLKVEWKVDEC